MLVLTDRALYRCAFSYRDGTLGEARRGEWAAYSQAHVGPFAYEALPPPSLLPAALLPSSASMGPGDWYLARTVDGAYGCRLFNRRPARAAPPAGVAAAVAALAGGGLGLLHDNVVDNGVYVTLSAVVPPVRGTERACADAAHAA